MFGAVTTKTEPDQIRTPLWEGETGGERKTAYHWGTVSSHRICLLLQVLQPFLDFVWLFRGGPPPGPAILQQEHQMLETESARKQRA